MAKAEYRQFKEVLEAELHKVDESYWKELQQISSLQTAIIQKLPLLDIQSEPEVYTSMKFEQLQAHLQVSRSVSMFEFRSLSIFAILLFQSLGGLIEIPASGDCLTSTVKTSAALCELFVNLGKISSRCKRLRRCVLWNAVAVVKIFKKR